MPNWTKKDERMYEHRAAELNIRGQSSMNKVELIEAIREKR